MEIGTIVFSKRGRDKGRLFIVIAAEDDYVYLTDGVMRPLETPKKKKIKHIQITNTVLDMSSHNFIGGLKNSDIKKMLREYENR